MDGILNPIYTINEAWKLVAVNRQKVAELGDRAETALGQPCFIALFDREVPCDHCLVGETLAGRQARQWSIAPVGEDNLPQAWDIYAYPLPVAPAGQVQAVIVWQDRTEERRLENSLMQAGKLAAIGQLAAGVAHEINNPLTAINANAEMLKMFISPEDENYESVDLIARAGERAANVVQHLLDFARQNQYTFEAGNVNQSLQQAIKLVSYQLQTAGITISCRLADDLPFIRASWEHLKTVWLNLMINARDALIARPENDHQPAVIEVETRLDRGGAAVQVLIRDNGIGMSSGQLAHIFEPFYTTKDPGRGTGLGLATSHRVIEQHGGQVEVVSRPGEGTTFIIHLPIARQVQQAGKS
jgi:two-component system NtrC family sensor kinase